MAESGTQMPAAFNVETGGEIRLFLVPDSGHRVAKLYVDGDDMGVQEYSAYCCLRMCRTDTGSLCS